MEAVPSHLTLRYHLPSFPPPPPHPPQKKGSHSRGSKKKRRAVRGRARRCRCSCRRLRRRRRRRCGGFFGLPHEAATLLHKQDGVQRALQPGGGEGRHRRRRVAAHVDVAGQLLLEEPVRQGVDLTVQEGPDRRGVVVGGGGGGGEGCCAVLRLDAAVPRRQRDHPQRCEGRCGEAHHRRVSEHRLEHVAGAREVEVGGDKVHHRLGQCVLHGCEQGEGVEGVLHRVAAPLLQEHVARGHAVCDQEAHHRLGLRASHPRRVSSGAEHEAARAVPVRPAVVEAGCGVDALQKGSAGLSAGHQSLAQDHTARYAGRHVEGVLFFFCCFVFSPPFFFGIPMKYRYCS
eukprot:Rhum_TRINITY_DN14706_c19_g1::Rhum_TRINITY_DN14706_c19_g1_i1::g.112094::m.112094